MDQLASLLRLKGEKGSRPIFERLAIEAHRAALFSRDEVSDFLCISRSEASILLKNHKRIEMEAAVGNYKDAGEALKDFVDACQKRFRSKR